MLPIRESTFCEVEMLTTASITCSATSAMFSGPRAAAVQAGRTTIAAVSAAASEPCRTSLARGRDMNKRDVETMGVRAPGEVKVVENVPRSYARRKAIARRAVQLGAGLGRK